MADRPSVHGSGDRQRQQEQRGFPPAQRFSRIPTLLLAGRPASRQWRWRKKDQRGARRRATAVAAAAGSTTATLQFPTESCLLGYSNGSLFFSRPVAQTRNYGLAPCSVSSSCKWTR